MFRYLLHEKIGNALVYLAERTNDLSLTKALKLLYIIDETSVKEIGVPVLWLEYKVWKYGPAAEEIYDEIKIGKKETVLDKEINLFDFISVAKIKNHINETEENIYIKAIRLFDDSEFSDYEIALLDRIVKMYGGYTAKELVDILHKEGTLWDKEVKKKDIASIFDALNGRSMHSIDLTELLKNDPSRQAAFKSAYEALHFQMGLLARATEQ